MKTQLNTLLNRVDTRLAACAAAAGASLAIVPSSDANIVYSGPVAIIIFSDNIGVYLNVVTGVNNPNPALVPGWDVNPYGTAALTMFSPAAPPGGQVYVGSGGYFNLTLGTLISAASTYSSGNLSGTSPNPLNFNTSNNIIGFRFQNEVTGTVQYGWFQVSLSSGQATQPRTIVAYAYEDTGAPIAAGAIPEPTTFALMGVMAIGALGVREWRKCKAA